MAEKAEKLIKEMKTKIESSYIKAKADKQKNKLMEKIEEESRKAGEKIVQNEERIEGELKEFGHIYRSDDHWCLHYIINV